MKNAVAIWIWLCAYLNCAGWFLSAIHELNAAGYAFALIIWIATLFVGKNFFFPVVSSPAHKPARVHKLFHRFKKPLPLAFLILSIMALLGGALYAPSNYDGLTYRLPRVLHWLAAGQWHWVHTNFPRLNNRACGIEWLSAPLISLFHTDRLLFLINFISFLLLPGLTFSVLSRLGVRRQVAWHWMWIAPTGYCFLLQAGSIGNDSFAAPFALAAIDFALSLKTSKQPLDFFSSVLAAALLTSAKTGNIPLLLPWAIAILPSLKIILQRPLATVVICMIALFTSFLPTAALNYRFCHDWSGLSLENIQTHPDLPLRTVSNVALVSILNLAPPVFPEADRWNRAVQQAIPPDLSLRLHQALVEPPAAEFWVPEMQMEENAGLGFGVTILLLVSVATAVVYRGKFLPFSLHSAEGLWKAGIIVTPWISTFALLTQSEVYPIGRIIAPFYILLLPLLLAPSGHERLLEKIWWRGMVFIVFALAALLLIISPARPLFPVKTVLNHLEAGHANSKLFTRIEEVYSVYRDRNQGFAPALEALPPGLKILGFVTYDDPETALWHPFGSRRVIHIRPDDTAAYLKGEGIEYILAKPSLFGTQFPAFNDWLATVNARLVQKVALNLRAESGASDWYLIELN
ncbi:MAG TPA: hypothetical protein VMH87_04730 [Pseudomonadales bacterium]|nr:hypothetical protein [Pseudomonadales bacterium]